MKTQSFMKKNIGISSETLENSRYEELREKLTYGINLAIQKMIERSKKLDEKIVISRDGKVLVINASEL